MNSSTINELEKKSNRENVVIMRYFFVFFDFIEKCSIKRAIIKNKGDNKKDNIFEMKKNIVVIFADGNKNKKKYLI